MSSSSMPKVLAGLLLMAAAQPTLSLESDRQQPLEVKANSTDGTLGDGTTLLRGDVEIRQGSLHITAEEAEVEKVEGKVRTVTLRGVPAYMEQEIEEQGLVQAEARTITYQVSNGLVTLAGEADVQHPQYRISGNQLTYDLGAQHFKGDGGEDGDGRIRIQLDPEVLPAEPPGGSGATGEDEDDEPAQADPS